MKHERRESQRQQLFVFYLTIYQMILYLFLVLVNRSSDAEINRQSKTPSNASKKMLRGDKSIHKCIPTNTYRYINSYTMIFMLLLYGFPNYISFDLIKFDPKEFCESILIQKTMMQKKKTH